MAVNRSPLWFRISCFLLLLFAVLLFVLSLGGAIYAPPISQALIPTLLVGIGLGVLVFAGYFHFVWRKQRASDSASHDANRKLTSVSQHVLDGILILDDAGVCLDCNPAACALLGVSPDNLVGQPIMRFHAGPEEFAHNWKTFLVHRYQRGRTQLKRADGKTLFVDYAIAANSLPGRHLMVLCDTTERKKAEASLRESEERLHLMTDNIQEVVWVMDANSKELLFVNPAYETVTGFSSAALHADRLSYQQMIHPEDRELVLKKLDEAAATGQFDEEFRIVRADGAVRWIWSRTFPSKHADQLASWLVGIAADITARKQAEAAAEAAHAETEALRKSTFALTQNLSMDAVLDTLLACLFDLVPYDSASVILAEDEIRLFVAREAPKQPGMRPFVTLETTESPLLQRVLVERKAVSIPDTSQESGWRQIKPLAGNRCWMGVPLMTAKGMFGLLSIGASTPRRFTPEHLRLAKSMAAPAAAAIYNVRLYERAEIYASELEHYIDELKQTQKQLENTRGREAS